MTLDKSVLYDWDDVNVSIFKVVNGIHGGDMYDTFMTLLSEIGDRHNFPYYLGGLLVYALFGFVMKKIMGQGGVKPYLAGWLAVFMVLIGGYAAEGVVIGHMKSYFSYPRPYVALSHDEVRVIEHRSDNDDMKSFPSGHAAFTTLMVIGLFPMLSIALRFAGVFLIIGVCWSRLALGVHFPADVLAGFFIALIIVWVMRAVVHFVLHKVLGLRH